MFPQREAIAKLLRDDDPGTVNLVKDQLAQQGSAAIPDLQDLLSIYDERVTEHVKDVMGRIDAAEARREMADLCRAFPKHGDIEAFSWVLARALLPGADVPACTALLDEWAAQLAGRGMPGGTAEDRVRALAYFLGDRLGFQGNTDDYYNPANTLLPCLLDTRLGIPISLTLLYMLLARRCGLRVDGINFPGHFLARHEGVLFDPFERGRIIGMEECRQILARQKLEFQPNHLEAATPIAMARRLLANLLYVYQSEENREAASFVTSWLHALERK